MLRPASMLAAAACLVVISCGSLVAPEDAGAEVGLDATTESEMDAVADSFHEATEDLWTPCGERPKIGEFTCCDGAPCRGGCDPSQGGVCRCAGVIGGCTAPAVCCPPTACTSEAECQWLLEWKDH